MEISGLWFGEPRGRGKLQVFPIHGPDTDPGFVGDIKVVSDKGDYGGLTVEVQCPTIVPQGLVFYFPGGQDRAVRRPVYIEDVLVGEPVEIDVVCVEPRQSGHWNKGQTQEKAMLPPSLMACLPASGRYSDLWKSISHRAKYDGKKADNVAALLKGRGDSPVEVDTQARGAMVVLDGRPVSIMIAPSRKAWRDWWLATDLGGVVTYDAVTLRDLPIPIGDQEMDEFPEVVGLCSIKWGPFTGWAMTDVGGVLCYVSLHDEEALKSFVPAQGRERSRPASVARQEMEEWGEK